jgi:hypothetical protein
MSVDLVVSVGPGESASACRELPMCYWAIAHSGSKIAVQPSADNVTMQIIAARAERGRSRLLSASRGATE